jgi:hypothetical protein
MRGFRTPTVSLPPPINRITKIDHPNGLFRSILKAPQYLALYRLNRDVSPGLKSLVC